MTEGAKSGLVIGGIMLFAAVLTSPLYFSTQAKIEDRRTRPCVDMVLDHDQGPDPLECPHREHRRAIEYGRLVCRCALAPAASAAAAASR